MTEMFFGEYPSFEELMNLVLELEKGIHEIKQCTKNNIIFGVKRGGRVKSFALFY